MAKRSTISKRPKKATIVNIRIEEDLKLRAMKAADDSGRSLSNYIRRLLEKNC